MVVGSTVAGALNHENHTRPGVIAEAEKLGLEVVDPFSGEKVEKMVRNYLATDPKILERVARLLGGKT